MVSPSLLNPPLTAVNPSISTYRANLSRLLTVCKDFIEALEACHQNTWSRYTGGCNATKLELNKCLHAQVRGYTHVPPLGVFNLDATLSRLPTTRV